MELNISLPYPPSVNHYWRTKLQFKRIIHYISTEGTVFRRKVYEAMLGYRCLQRIDSGSVLFPTERLIVTVSLFPPNKRRFDIDNRLKGLLDALEHARAYNDDNQIDKLIVIREEAYPKNGKCEVTVKKLDEINPVIV